jgi:hypothetical protein
MPRGTSRYSAVPSVQANDSSVLLDPNTLSLGAETHPTRPALLAALWSKIQSFSAVQCDWGENDCVQVSRETIDVAGNLLSDLSPEIPIPQATASSDGEIVLTWFHGGNRMEAAIASDRHLTWVCRIDGCYVDGQVVDLVASNASNRVNEGLAAFFA